MSPNIKLQFDRESSAIHLEIPGKLFDWKTASLSLFAQQPGNPLGCPDFTITTETHVLRCYGTIPHFILTACGYDNAFFMSLDEVNDSSGLLELSEKLESDEEAACVFLLLLPFFCRLVGSLRL